VTEKKNPTINGRHDRRGLVTTIDPRGGDGKHRRKRFNVANWILPTATKKPQWAINFSLLEIGTATSEK